MVHGFRDQPMKIGVSLAVGVIHDVDGNAINVNCKVGPVIRIETSEKVLVRLPAPLMLNSIKTRNGAGENIGRSTWMAKHHDSFPHGSSRHRRDDLFAEG